MADPRLMTIQTQNDALPLQRPHSQPLIRPYPLLNGCVLALLPVRGNKWHDFSPQENHGTFTSTGFKAQGRFGPGVYFDGSADYVSVADHASLDITDELTLEVWVKFNQVENWRYLIAKDAGTAPPPYALMVHASYVKLYCAHDDVDTNLLSSSMIPSIDTWYHIVGTLSVLDTSQQIYVNGVEKATYNWTYGSLRTNIDDAWVGRRYTNYFNGTIDEVKIWNRALSAEEIKYLYELGRPY